MSVQNRSEEQNLSLIREYYEAWVRGDPGSLDGFLAQDLQVHVGSQTLGRDALIGFRSSLSDEFSELSVTEEDAIAEGAKVVMRWRGRQISSASGLLSEIYGVTIYRIESDKIAEIWDFTSPVDVRS